MYRKALKLDPHSALILKNLGTNLLAEHKYNKGWEAYQQALAIDPQIFSDHGAPSVENPSNVQERGAMNYYMAAGCARAGYTDCALQYLRMALDEGFTTRKKVANRQRVRQPARQPRLQAVACRRAAQPVSAQSRQRFVVSRRSSLVYLIGWPFRRLGDPMNIRLLSAIVIAVALTAAAVAQDSGSAPPAGQNAGPGSWRWLRPARWPRRLWRRNGHDGPRPDGHGH